MIYNITSLHPVHSSMSACAVPLRLLADYVGHPPAWATFSCTAPCSFAGIKRFVAEHLPCHERFRRTRGAPLVHGTRKASLKCDNQLIHPILPPLVIGTTFVLSVLYTCVSCNIQYSSQKMSWRKRLLNAVFWKLQPGHAASKDQRCDPAAGDKKAQML